MEKHKCIGCKEKMLWLPEEEHICRECYPDFYETLKSENARLTKQYEEAMTSLGQIKTRAQTARAEVLCEAAVDMDNIARALIAKHDKEKEGKGN